MLTNLIPELIKLAVEDRRTAEKSRTMNGNAF